MLITSQVDVTEAVLKEVERAPDERFGQLSCAKVQKIAGSGGVCNKQNGPASPLDR